MRRSAALAFLWIAGVSFGAVGPTSQPGSTATAPSPAETLAVAGLNHAARSLGHLRNASVVARFGRMRALLRYAQRLLPEDAKTNRHLVELYEGMGDVKPAVAAGDLYVQARPGDYAFAIRWMRLTEQTLGRADERVAFLEKVAAQERLLPEIRAAAAAGQAGIRLRQGEEERARSACQQALHLDPSQPAALQALAQIRSSKDAGPFRSLEDSLALFGGNPRSLEIAWELARQLQAAGLYDKALVFYEHAHALSEQLAVTRGVVESLLIDYLNGLLDAGRPERVVELFELLVKEHGHSLALRSLVVEAYRSLRKDEQADVHVEFMARVYDNEAVATMPATTQVADRSAAQSAERAWFNLRFRVRPEVALGWANRAFAVAPKDFYVQRVLGAARLRTGDVAGGTQLLKPLAKTDPFAAAVLARHYYAQKDPAAGREVLLEAAGDLRTGPGWRELAAVAAEQQVVLPAVAHARAMREALTRLPPTAFELGRYPERSVSVRLTAGDEVALGEPVTVTVELKNTSEHTLALGADGLFRPEVLLRLKIEGAEGAGLPTATLVQLPAPKYLRPGRSVSETVRMDVGAAEQFLMAHPLAGLKMTIVAVLDPLQRGKQMISTVPSLKISPVTVSRPALFAASGDKTAAQYALGYIVRDLKGGDLARQVRAARQTASLLANVRRVESGKAAAVFPDVLTKPILLSMTQASLRAPSPAVRAEMLAALQHVDLDQRIIALMGPNVRDPAPLVRMRLIELLASKRTKGYETLLEVFAKDTDSSVRQMAAAVGGGR